MKLNAPTFATQVLWVVATLCAAACRDDSASDKGPDTDKQVSDDIDLDTTYGLGLGAGESCSDNEGCEGAAICHPIAKQCVSEGADCREQDECGAERYCDPDTKTCLVGVAGSPCAGDRNYSTGSVCAGGQCSCTGFVQEQETLAGPLDVYFVFDRTGSMGDDCDYERGSSPPTGSKACSATYALSDYLINVSPQVDTRLAFQFMSLPGHACDGSAYSEPLVSLVDLPLEANHQIVRAISDESFEGGYGTEIEGALRGIATFTEDNASSGREMIGILMTDGDPRGCNEGVDALAEIVEEHQQRTGIRTFIIGMSGATEENLERLAIAGGAESHDDFLRRPASSVSLLECG